MSKFTIKNGDVLREDVVIGKVVEGEIQISDEFKNFKGPALKALKPIIDGDNPPPSNQGNQPPAITPEMQAILDENEKLKKEKADLLEMQADKMENNTPPPASDLEAENAKLRDQLAKANARYENDPRVAIEEPPLLEDREDADNPFRIPEEQIKENVPPCPPMDWRGTKTPECVDWLYKHYPEFAKKRFAKFTQKKKVSKMKEEKRKQKEAQAKKEREMYPREGGSIYPYNIQ